MVMIICLSMILGGCYDMYPVEEVGVVVGLGYDIKNTKGKTTFIDPAEVLEIKGGSQVESDTLVGKGRTIYSLAENRRMKQSKKFILGTEILYMFSEERAKFGIKDILQDALNDPSTNSNAFAVVCKDKCEDYFDLKGASGTNTEILKSMLEFAHLGNFFPHNVTMNEVFRMYHQQGRIIVLPYIEIINSHPQITGISIFYKDKMVEKIPMEEAKLINLLRSKEGTGSIYILSEDPRSYIEMTGKNKNKVKVSKKEDILKYDIFVDISGGLKIDTLRKQKIDKKKILEIEKLFSKQLEKKLNEEIVKIQKLYKIDCLDLGKYAIAKYGRDSGYDKEDYFSNAEIKAHVNIKIKTLGRIVYYH